jgi:RNA polymerase sigma-B factor
MISNSPPHASPQTYRDDLLVQYYQHPTIEMRNQLVRIHTGLVRKIAHRFRRQCNEPFEDLQQLGFMGLIRAIERFNPEYGCTFSSFAVPYIRGEILHFLRDRSNMLKIPRRWQELYKQGEQIRENVAKEQGYQPDDQEIAKKLSITLQEWSEICLARQNRSLLSLDCIVSQQSDGKLNFSDVLPDPHTQAIQAQEEDRQQVHSALSTLEAKTRQIINLVYYQGVSQRATSAHIGVSPMTVSRRISAGVKQMITMLQPTPQ